MGDRRGGGSKELFLGGEGITGGAGGALWVAVAADALALARSSCANCCPVNSTLKRPES